MSLTRRLFMRAAGAGAVAAPMAANAVAQTLGASAPGALVGSAGYAYGNAVCSSPGGTDPLKAAIRKALRQKERDASHRKAYRVGGFDVDLLALGSMSLAGRVASMRRRDRALEDPIETLHRQIWPEDFE